MTWADGRLTEAGLYSSQRRRVVVRAKDVMGVSDGGGSVRVERLTRDRIGFMAEAGARYRLRFTP
jgi:hypothetical protein